MPRGKSSKSLEQRFREKTAERGECWVWHGAGAGTGMPVFDLDGKRMTARRAAWALFCPEPLREGAEVLSCAIDKLCVNPAHLKPGTHSDALQQASGLGRLARRPVARGASHGNAKLADDDVICIRRSLAAGVSRADIAAHYKMAWQAIDAIEKRDTWAHVPEDAPWSGALVPSRPVLSDVARFEKKVAKLPGGCWLWRGAVVAGHGGKGNRYGQFWLVDRRLGAHVAAYKLYVGEVPDGMFVCHDCPGGDNSLCVNPEHLFLGTADENNIDTLVKGLGRQIRERLAKNGATHTSVAFELNLPESAIRALETWRPPRRHA